ncbi:MAG: hypothetical protein N0E44_15715 [Candidatus Thiodiazotropha lotti]|nr:hypothetical protein [Candidatus Thiodiazotropha lotti]MCW4221331.1 hypothetical protein [Candidatus Thiodiazotropha lotti]
MVQRDFCKEKKMVIKPENWNVLVLGAWNPAILTPDGIRKLLYKLPEGTPVDVEVVIDRIGPQRVRHDGLIVSASSRSLDVGTEHANPETIEKAANLAINGLTALPETPLSAVGVNFRFRMNELPDNILELIKAPLDDVLSDAGQELLQRKVFRTISFPPGALNLDLADTDSGEGFAVFNFHMDSRDHDVLVEWLGRTQEFHQRVLEILHSLNLESLAEGNAENV